MFSVAYFLCLVEKEDMQHAHFSLLQAEYVFSTTINMVTKEDHVIMERAVAKLQKRKSRATQLQGCARKWKSQLCKVDVLSLSRQGTESHSFQRRAGESWCAAVTLGLDLDLG